MRRIDWNEITNVEQKKRGRYKGTEYSAISIDYFDKKSINNEIISSIIITRSNIMNSLRKHVLELLSYYKVAEKLSDVENQILISIYAGAFNFNSPSISTSIADAFEISEEELKEHMNHLSEVEMIKGLSKEGSPKLTKKGIKYVVELSKEGTFGG
jgi:helix-turn-helix protein